MDQKNFLEYNKQFNEIKSKFINLNYVKIVKILSESTFITTWF